MIESPAIYAVYDIRTDIRPTVAEIDLASLRQNVDVLASCVGRGVGVMAVVKADAYGHGAVAVARALEKKVWGFGVSLVEEGIELRRAGVEAPILVLGSFYGRSHRDVLSYRLIPVVSDVADLPRFLRAAEDLDLERVSVHLKIDTGMSRLGVRPENLDAFVDAVLAEPRIDVAGLCTHFADADVEDTATSRAQLDRFEECRARLTARGIKPALTHVANSAGLVRFTDARFDVVRPGIAVYGVAPSRHASLVGLRPALQWKSRVVALRQVPRGTRISYGGATVVDRDTRIATVPVGYADGYQRRMSGRAVVLVGGKRCPVVGAITMDMCMVDVGDLAVSVGDEVVLLGAQGDERILVEELAAWAETIPWEIFCGISKRVPRVYTGERY